MKLLEKISSRISPLWLMPITAIFIVIWLIYRGYVNSGTEVVIEFNAGDKILAGKTNLEYKGIEIGKVTAVDIQPNNVNKVLVTAKFKKGADILARDGTSFWIVKPKVGINEISGLETILSGIFIEVRPPAFITMKEFLKRGLKTKFVGLTSAPNDENPISGEKFEFYSSKKGGLDVGSGIYFRDVKIGQIQEIALLEDHSAVKFKGIIYDEYKKLSEYPFYLWRQGVLDIKFNLNQISFKTTTFKSFIEGRMELGIFTFASAANKKRKTLKLYDSEALAQKEYIRSTGGKEIVLEVSDNNKILEGGPIYYKNIIVGELGKFKLDVEKDKNTISAYIFPEYARLLKNESMFWPVFDVSASLEKTTLKVNIPLVAHMFNGGVEFENIENANSLNKNGSFLLFSSKQAALHAIESAKPVLHLILKSQDRKSLEIGSPVTYRQIQVGKVTAIKLSSNSKEVEIYVAIDREFAHLIKKESRFWVTSGFRAKLGFSGLKMETDSLTSLVSGGIAFATPTEKYGVSAKSNEAYKLYDEPEKEWLKWAPAL